MADARPNVVMFWFMNDWGKWGRAYEQVAKALKRSGAVAEVVCILPPRRQPGLGLAARAQGSAGTVRVISPFEDTVNGVDTAYRLRRWLTRRLPPLLFVRLYLHWLGLRRDNTVLWIFPPHPYADDLVAGLPHDRLVVQIVDNNTFVGHLDDRRTQIQAQYEALARRADCTITSSAVNHDIFAPLSRRCVMVENGVGAEFIATPTLPPHRRGNARPVLGYVAAISERTDLALLRQVALQRPGCDLVIAGPDWQGLVQAAGLLALPNVRYLGEVEQARVPALMQSFDVCLIPHHDTAFSRTMSPLKLFQYLGSGRPVVSTRVAGVERWQDLVHVADDEAGFLAGIDAALAEDGLDTAAQRIQRVRAEGWDSRVAAMLDAIGVPRPREAAA